MTSRPLDPAKDLRDCLKTVDLNGVLTFMDEDGLCVMEIDRLEDVVGKSWASFWPTETQPQVAAAVREAAAGRVSRFRADCPTAKGAMKSWDVSVAPIRDASGRVVALQSLSQDVTQREFDRAETALVSRELAHRLKNLLAVIESLVVLSARSQPEAKTFVDTFRQRLAGISRAVNFIHPMGSADLEAAPKTLHQLMRAVLAPYDGVAGRIVFSGRDLGVGIEALTSLALVINELTTNAVKYGALRHDTGELRISTEVVGDQMEIDWVETGPSAPSNRADGFGTRLVDTTLRGQLGGEFKREWTPTGLRLKMCVPLSRLG